MAKHSVKFAIPERKLGKADVEFTVNKDGKAMGRLKVSNGSLVWVPKNKTYGYKMGWTKFHQLMVSKGKYEGK